jgi:Zn-dependent peptidase ImmA (M78 family)
MRGWQREISELATGVLENYRKHCGATDIAELIPLRVNAIADELYDLRVRYVGDMGNELSACLDAEARVVEINAGEPIVRRRFSLAHEIGHFLRHAKDDGSSTFHRCTSAVMENLGELKPEHLAGKLDYEEMKRRAEHASILQGLLGWEKEANAFAAELLIPTGVVIVLAPKHGNSPRELAKRFGVSVESMTWRMTKLRLIQGFSRQMLLPWDLVRG